MIKLIYYNQADAEIEDFVLSTRVLSESGEPNGL
jgi:hypothetical protein